MTERESVPRPETCDHCGKPWGLCECDPRPLGKQEWIDGHMAVAHELAVKSAESVPRPERDDILVRIGASLRSRRESLHLSQQAVASAIGKTQVWLSYLEAGKRNPRLADLDLLLRELDMVMTLRVKHDV